MSAQLLPISEVTQRATNALIKEIGVVDTIRFLNQFRAGAGNYTQEREKLFEGLSVRDIVREIKARRTTTPDETEPKHGGPDRLPTIP